MRLAIVTHNVVRGDGQGRVNIEIARYALQQGIGVWLAADRVDADILELGASWISVCPRRRRVNLLKVMEFTRRADLALRALPERMDVIHGNGYVLTQAHQVNTAHFVHAAWRQSPMHSARLRRDLNGLYQWVYSTLNARWEQRAYAQARVVVAISERVRRELIAAGVDAGRIRVIPNGVDIEEFHPGGRERGPLSLPEEVPLALFVGDIRSPRKNLDTVLRALRFVPDLHLAVVGETAGSPYPAMAAALGLDERVHFLGFRKDVDRIMRAADLFVSPARYEPFSLVVLEAMASGLPVIVAATVGAADLVTPEAGIVLPEPDDARRLASALCALVADAPRRCAMGQAARAIAEQHSWDHMAASYLQLYSEVAA
ncbi:MAG TPA: glycosyltransferase family 4 protein [Chthonomonadaceae bacterium]|nr:glycosyltransferase family 4 protein [Chthonomonadaceae bacterium]